MDLLAAQTHAAKHEAQQIEAQLRTATEQLSKRSQEISVLKVRCISTYSLRWLNENSCQNSTCSQPIDSGVCVCVCVCVCVRACRL